MTREDIAKACIDAGLATRTADILEAARPSLQLILAPTDMAELSIGESRVGGVPDLPAATAWPEWRDGPLSFIAQIDLHDLASRPAAALLPRSGHLLFFYHAEQKTWGFDPKDRGSWHVLYTPPETQLARFDPPRNLPEEGRYRPCGLSYREVISIAAPDSADCVALHLTPQQRDAYFEVYDALFENGHGASSWMLGHPEQIQGDMQTECALVTGGLYTGDQSGWRDPRRLELEADARSWRLLFQVGSEDAAGMMWGDVGCLYYWIHQRDLAAHDFSHTWMVLQCL
jgi:uncharacterized protein YwqG